MTGTTDEPGPALRLLREAPPRRNRRRPGAKPLLARPPHGPARGQGPHARAGRGVAQGDDRQTLDAPSTRPQALAEPAEPGSVAPRERRSRRRRGGRVRHPRRVEVVQAEADARAEAASVAAAAKCPLL